MENKANPSDRKVICSKEKKNKKKITRQSKLLPYTTVFHIEHVQNLLRKWFDKEDNKLLFIILCNSDYMVFGIQQ